MSRMDRHVTFVQGKLATSIFVDSLSGTVAAFFAACGVAILLNRTLQLALPHPQVWALATLGVAVIAALTFAIIRKPDAHTAAVEIDRRLGLKEKYSTALYARNTSDPFAAAAVRDAERASDNVSLYRQFPLARPRHLYLLIASAVAAGAILWLVPQMDLLGREAQKQKLAEVEKKQAHAKDVVKQALATVNSYPKALQNQKDIQLAKAELQNMLNQPVKDPEQTGRSAMKALNDANEAIKEQIRNNQQFATAQNEQRAFASMNTPSDEKGPVADASRAIAKGDFSKAADELKKATDQFNKMNPEQQKKSVDQMKSMAQQLAKMASDPSKQQELQKKLQQMGATKEQAQQMQQMMQQAAQGNPQAQHQLQQLKQQLTKQMQQQGGNSPQQQQAMQQALKQMQANANTQQTAQQMAQAAQQMAQAMQQAQQGQQSSQGQQQSASKGQSGQQNSQSQQQQMANAQQQMQQQMQQMDAIAQDAKEVAAAQQATESASQDASQEASGQNPSNMPGQMPGAGGKGSWREGNPGNQKGNGSGGPGRGGGAAGGITEAPYAVKAEVAHSKDIATGRTLASTFVKAGTVKGDARIGLSNVAASALNDSTDDVDEQNVSKQSQQVVKQYFETMQTDR